MENALGASNATVATLKCATQRGKIGSGRPSRYTLKAKHRFWTMMVPTGAMKKNHAMSLSRLMSCGSRSGLNAALPQQESARMNPVAPTPTQMMYAYVRTGLDVAAREICTAVTAKSGTSEQAIRLHRIATPRIPVLLSLKNAATSSGVSVGDSGGENTGNVR